MLLNQVSLFQYDEGIGGDALKKCAKQAREEWRYWAGTGSITFLDCARNVGVCAVVALRHLPH